MGEYGRVVGETSGTVGGGSGRGSSDLGGDVMGVFSDLLDQVATLPMEVMAVIVGVMIVGGFIVSMRTS
jgi:hypothetical protein